MHAHNWPHANTPVHTLTLLLVAMHQQLTRHVLSSCESYGIAPSEFDVLAALRRSAPPYELTPTEILRRTVVTSGGLTKILHRLAEKGWIERITDAADRRSIRARLTPAGNGVIEEAMDRLLGQLHWMEGSLSAGEMRELIHVLRRLWAAGEARPLRPDT